MTSSIQHPVSSISKVLAPAYVIEIDIRIMMVVQLDL
jgi:hypothetical protein